MSAPRAQALLRRGFFFSRFRLFGGDKSPTSKTKTRIRPLFRHAQHIKIDVLGDLNAQYTCLRCLISRGITLLTRLRGGRNPENRGIGGRDLIRSTIAIRMPSAWMRDCPTPRKFRPCLDNFFFFPARLAKKSYNFCLLSDSDTISFIAIFQELR